MILQHMDYFMSPTLPLYRVSLYFVVDRILAFLCTSLMLCQNKIQKIKFISFRAAIFKSFDVVLKSFLQFEGRALYT